MRPMNAVLWIVLCLTFSVSAWASPSNSTLRALEGERVRVTTASDQTHEGILLTFNDQQLTVVDSEGNVHELERNTVEKVQLPQKTHAAAPSKSADAEVAQAVESAPQRATESGSVMERDAQAKARADFLREQRELERTGSAYRISGGVVTGVGALTAFSAMMSLAITGPHMDTWREERSRDTLRTGAVITAVVGTAITASGVGLIVMGNNKRRRARATYQKSFDLSLSPQFSARGGGAEMHLRF